MNIYGYPVVEEDGINEEGMYLSIFYYLYFIKERTMDMLEEQPREERYPGL